MSLNTAAADLHRFMLLQTACYAGLQTPLLRFAGPDVVFQHAGDWTIKDYAASAKYPRGSVVGQVRIIVYALISAWRPPALLSSQQMQRRSFSTCTQNNSTHAEPWVYVPQCPH